MLLAVLGIVAGLALLTYSADQFVVGAARVSTALRLSTVVVGAVVIGFGTSAPELLVSGLAGAQGSLDLAVGNIVGSNVANLTLVLGVAALISPIAVRSPVIKREAPIALFAVLVFAWTLRGGLSLLDGVVLSVVLVVSLAIIIIASRGGDPALAAEVTEMLSDAPPRLSRESARTLVGLVGTLGAAWLVVASATMISAELGLAEGFVGLTIVAIGTSLPELATAVQAARKRETDLIVGNLLGSNLFNAAAVGATAAFSGAGLPIDDNIAGTGTILMVGVSVAATAFMITGKRVVRWEAVVLLVAYVATVPLLAG